MLKAGTEKAFSPSSCHSRFPEAPPFSNSGGFHRRSPPLEQFQVCESLTFLDQMSSILSLFVSPPEFYS